MSTYAHPFHTTPLRGPLRTGSRRLLLGLVAAAAQDLCLAQPVAASPRPPAAETGAQSQDQREAARLLQQQGRYWQRRNKPALAADAWSRLLALRPHDPEAVYGLAWSRLPTALPAQSQAELARLKKLPGGGAYADRFVQDIALAGKAGDLQRARDLQRNGKPDEAVAVYRQVFAGMVPTGPVAVDYYTALGGTLDGWDEARAGLARLVESFPGDRALALAYAQHLTYADATRREGIGRLAGLVDASDIGRQADVSWRKAVEWLASVPSDIPYLKHYLSRHPDDQPIRAALADLTKATEDGAFQQIEPDPAIDLAERAFRSLQAGQLDTAAAGFEGALRLRPQLARALGGMGLVRLRQQRFTEAADWLSRARKLAKPGEARAWDSALQSSRYWAVFQDAEAARLAGDTNRALDLLSQARTLDPNEASTDIASANIHFALGQYPQAAGEFGHALVLRKGDPAALRGLITTLAADGRADDAQAVIAELPEAARAGMGDLRAIQGGLAAAQGRAAEARGDLPDALARYASAVGQTPDDAWTRLAMARLLLQQGRVVEATTVMDAQPAMPADAPVDNIARGAYSRALFDTEREQWQAARVGLESVPPAGRSPQMQALLVRVTVFERLAAGASATARGAAQEAAAQRSAARDAAAGVPELELKVAVAAVEAGDADALARARAEGDFPDAGLPVGPQLQYAAALFAAQQDEPAGRLLSRLSTAELSPAQRQGVDGLVTGSAVRAAYRLLDAGDVPGARAALADAWRLHPDDMTVLLAQGSILSRAGEHRAALEVYRGAIVRSPLDTRLLLAAAESADAADHASAAEFMDRAVASAPGDARVLATAGKYWRRAGQTERAEQLLAAAISADASARARPPAPVVPRAPPGALLPTRKASTLGGATMRRMAWREGGPAPGFRKVALAAADSESGPLGDLRSAPLAPTGELLDPWVRPASPPLTLEERTALQAELDSVRFERSPVVSTGLVVRSRQGEPGLSKLTDIQTPVEARWTLGEARLLLRVTPTRLNAGFADLAVSGDRFGAGAPANNTSERQSDKGVGVAVGYERPDLQTDIGTTPLGFDRVEVVGGVRVMRKIDPAWSWSGELSRRAVTDSLLSFAGARDSRTGASTGGVTATGGRFQLGWDQGSWGLYSFAALHALRGSGVRDNSRVEVGGGIYKHLWQQPDSRLTSGLNLSALSYDRNLRYFTSGHGGYFSPQDFVSASVPIDWSERRGNFAWRLRGSAGVQRFREDASSYFPQDSAMQAAAGAAAVYPGQRRSGFAYNASVAMEYHVTPRVFVGALVAADNSRDYRQRTAGVYLRVNFEPSHGLVAFPVEPLRSPYGRN